MTARLILIFVLLHAWSCSIPLLPLAYGFQMYQQAIPNGDNVYRNGEHYPAVGHAAPSWNGTAAARNVFGLDFITAEHTWTKELCERDSDQDGFTNGAELGDPECVWQGGMTPSRTTDISHPAFSDSVPTTMFPPTSSGPEAAEYNVSGVTMTFEIIIWNYSRIVLGNAIATDLEIPPWRVFIISETPSLYVFSPSTTASTLTVKLTILNQQMNGPAVENSTLCAKLALVSVSGFSHVGKQFHAHTVYASQLVIKLAERKKAIARIADMKNDTTPLTPAPPPATQVPPITQPPPVSTQPLTYSPVETKAFLPPEEKSQAIIFIVILGVCSAVLGVTIGTFVSFLMFDKGKKVPTTEKKPAEEKPQNEFSDLSKPTEDTPQVQLKHDFDIENEDEARELEPRTAERADIPAESRPPHEIAHTGNDQNEEDTNNDWGDDHGDDVGDEAAAPAEADDEGFSGI